MRKVWGFFLTVTSEGVDRVELGGGDESFTCKPFTARDHSSMRTPPLDVGVHLLSLASRDRLQAVDHLLRLLLVLRAELAAEHLVPVGTTRIFQSSTCFW